MSSKFVGGNFNCKHEIDLYKTPKEHQYLCKYCEATIMIYPMVLSKKDMLEVEIESLEKISFLYEDEMALEQARKNLEDYLKGDQEPYIQEYIQKIKNLIKKYNAYEYYKEYLEKAEQELKDYQNR